jgi:hypothetical protein
LFGPAPRGAPRPRAGPHDAAQASTSIRPLISMCIAWQKNVQ